MSGARVVLAALLAGWIAESLARPDGDVEAGIEAYEAGDYDVALEHFDAAIARHGDQPELSLDRGLVLLAQGQSDGARRAFERASEAKVAEVRASGFYELGNVAFDAEDWDAAIEAYIECLKARPEHANAKWNLELARLRKQQDEDEDEEEEDEEEDEDEDSGGSDSGGSDSGGSDSGGSDTGGSDDGGGDTGGSTGEPPDDSGTTGDQGGSSGGDEGDSGEQGGSDEAGESGEPPDDGGTGGPPPDQPPPQPLDQMDIQKALDELDAQDSFPLDRPQGGVRPPTEDW